MGFLLLGLDSLIICLAVGGLVERGSLLRFAALFGVADAAAFLVGSGLGWQLSGALTGALQTGIMVGLALYLLVFAAGLRQLARWPLWVLPWALTLDNLAYGVAGDNTGASLFQQAGAQALSSTLLALVGLAVAVTLPRLVPAMGRRAPAFAGGALLLATGGFALLG
jgi:putative Mn2+ efflux pump MntP